jgi:hypothetical protein
LKNLSKEAVCIGARTFEPSDNGLLLKDMAGHRIGRSRIGYWRPRDFHGVDLNVSYDLLFPGTTEEFYTTPVNYTFAPGAYTYEWFIWFHVCRDLVDLEKTAADHDAMLHLMHITGRLTVDKPEPPAQSTRPHVRE